MIMRSIWTCSNLCDSWENGLNGSWTQSLQLLLIEGYTNHCLTSFVVTLTLECKIRWTVLKVTRWKGFVMKSRIVDIIISQNTEVSVPDNWTCLSCSPILPCMKVFNLSLNNKIWCEIVCVRMNTYLYLYVMWVILVYYLWRSK